MSIKNNTTSLQAILETINSLPEAGGDGVALPTLTNPAQASEIFLNKETIDANGNIKTGTFTIDSELSTQDELITQIQNALANKASGSTPVLQDKTITPSVEKQIITADNGYDGLETVTVNAVPTQTKNITPTTAAQNVTPDNGKFLSKVTVAGDSNLVAENIKNGISIFGVNGTLEEGGGSGEASEWSENEDAIINKTLKNYTNDRIRSIGSYAFYSCRYLTTVSFPACTSIGISAFYSCRSLTTVSFPACTSIGSYAFYSCSSLTTVSFPVCTNIGSSAFDKCSSLTTVSFPVCTNIGSNAFDDCSSLTTVSFPVCTNISYNAFYNCRYLTTVSFPACTSIGSYAFGKCSSLTTVSFPVCTNIGSYAFYSCYRISNIQLGASSVCILSNSNAFSSTPFAGYSSYFSGTPYIYVPASLVDAYKSATNWVYFSSYISAIEDMP